MKEHDWSHKMKPSEYEKVRTWCRENGYREIDKNVNGTNFQYLHKHVLVNDGLRVCIDTVGSKFLHSNQQFLYVCVEIMAYKALSTGLYDTLSVHRYISTLEELKSLTAKKDEFLKLAKEFGV
jgi:hypothetical protein